MKLTNLKTLTFMELKKIFNSKRQLLILVLGAIIPCLAFGLVVHNEPQDISIAVFIDRSSQSSLFEHKSTSQIITEIDKSTFFSVSKVDSMDKANERLKNGNSRAIVVFHEGPVDLDSTEVIVDSTDHSIQQTIQKELPAIIRRVSKTITLDMLTSEKLSPQQANQLVNPLNIETRSNQWLQTRFIDFAVSPFIVLIVLGISLLGAVTAITSERTHGTIERLFISPYKLSEIILSKMFALGIIAVFVVIAILLTLFLLFGVSFSKPLLTALIAFLVGINGIIFGLLVSSITYNELESVALGITSWFLFMTLMSFIWPLETMHPLFKWIASLTPYLYGVHGLRHVSLVGWGFVDVWKDIAILCGFIVVQTLLTIRILRREIK